MPLHSFTTKSLLDELGGTTPNATQPSFSSHFLLLEALRRAGKLTLVSALIGMGGIASSEGASSGLNVGVERRSLEEEQREEDRRSQRYGSRLSYANIAAWQQGEADWVTVSPSYAESTQEQQTPSAPSTHIVVSRETNSSWSRAHDVDSINSYDLSDSVSARSYRSDASLSGSDAMLELSPSELFERTKSAAPSAGNYSQASGESLYSSQSALESEAGASVIGSTASLRSVSPSQAISERDGSYSGEMDFQMPQMDAAGRVIGAGDVDTLSQTTATSSYSHSAARSESSFEEVSLYPKSEMSASQTLPVEPSVLPETQTQPVQYPSTVSIPASFASPVASAPGLSSARFDQQFLELRHQIKQDRRVMYGGVAAAMAMPSVTPSPGKTAIAVGAAHFQGQSALGIGAAWRSLSGQTHVNVAVGASAAAVGVRVQAAREF